MLELMPMPVLLEEDRSKAVRYLDQVDMAVDLPDRLFLVVMKVKDQMLRALVDSEDKLEVRPVPMLMPMLELLAEAAEPSSEDPVVIKMAELFLEDPVVKELFSEDLEVTEDTVVKAAVDMDKAAFLD